MVNNFQRLLDDRDVLLMLTSVEKIKSLLHEVGLYDSSSQFSDAYADILHFFSVKHQQLMCGYLCGEKSLWEITKVFIEEVVDHAPVVSRAAVLKSLEKHDAISNEYIYQTVMNMKSQEKMSILGFGLADGEFELELVEQLKKQGKAQEITLYGLDPSSHGHRDIVSICEKDICNSLIPKFDLIISRWVLHHVESNHRWQSFIHCLNNLTGDGLAIVVEEGIGAQPSREKSSLFFIATVDVLANYYLWPGYLTSEKNKYFAQYLLDDDLEKISLAAKLPYVRKEVGPIFPNQSVIVFSSQLSDKYKALVG